MKKLALALLTWTALVPFHASAAPGVTALTVVSPQGDSLPPYPAISSDGRLVAFASKAAFSNDPSDTNSSADIFVYDRNTSSRERISTTASGAVATGPGGVADSTFPAISSDGRYVVFQSVADNLVAGDTNGQADIFIVDRQAALNTANRIRRVSVRPGGVQTSAASGDPSISADGRYVAFYSADTGLVAGTSGAINYIYIVDTTQIGTVAGITRIPVPNAPSPSNISCFASAISGDGNFVAFNSFVSDASGSSAFNYADVYLYNRSTTVLTPVTGEATTFAQGVSRSGKDSRNPSLSFTGNSLAFQSNVALTVGDTNGNPDVFVYDRQSTVFTLVSVTAAGVQGNDWSTDPSISGDGRFVAFESFASNLVPVDANGGQIDIFRKDLLTGALSLCSTTAGGAVQSNAQSDAASLSSDGLQVAFMSRADNLGATNPAQDFNTFVATLQSSIADLQNLTTTAGALTPTFDKNVLSYTASVPNTTGSITITPTLADALNATVKVNNVTVTSGSASGSILLNVGPNTITTVVTAQDGTTKTYTVIVTRLSVPLAEALDTTGLTWSTGGNQNWFGQTITTHDGVDAGQSGDVNDTEESWAETTVTGPGTLTFWWKVSSEGTFDHLRFLIDGVEQPGKISGTVDWVQKSVAITAGAHTLRWSYLKDSSDSVGADAGWVDEVTFTGSGPSSNADLQSLTTTAGALTPTFASNVTSYTASVPNATTSITITPTVQDINATVKVNSVTVLSGNASGPIALNVGANPINTVVTAQDGTMKTYTLTVTRAAPLSSNANLQNLTTTAGALTPTFASNVTSYTASVPNATTSITITPTVQDINATVKVNSVTVLSGNASGPISLNVGANPINTVVTAQDGTMKTYTITITRAALSTNADLQSLTTTAGALTPTFASNVTSYTASVPNATTSITITPTVQDINATVKVNNVTVTSGNASGPISLNVGANPIDTVVTAQDGTMKTYTVIVTRLSVTLAGALDTTGLTWSTGGNQNWFGQTITTHDGVDAGQSGDVNDTQESWAETTVTGPGTLTFWWKVSSESGFDFLRFLIDGVEQPGKISGTVDWVQKSVAITAGAHTLRWSYLKDSSDSVGADAGWVDEVTFTGSGPSSNADLQDLTTTAGALTPTFASNVTSYTASVPNATTSITITPTVQDINATVKVNSVTVLSGNASGPISLNVGANPINTVVTAQDGTMKTYTLTVTRAAPLSSNADLQNLTTTAGALTPPFASNVTSYTASVPNATASITITPTVQDPNATVKVNNVTVTSGNASGPISLIVGANPIDTVVTAQDGTMKTYTITVVRMSAGSNNADLQNLITTDGTLTPNFASNVLNYTASVSFATTSIGITPILLDPSATVKVNNTVVLGTTFDSAFFLLSVGANQFDTVVTAQDGTTMKTYRITVTRAAPASNNADLQSLATTAGALTPTFASNVTSYTVSVPNLTDSITISPTVADNTATVKVNTVTVASGNASGSIFLNVGPNTITTVVTAQDGTTTKTYTVTVTRAGSNNADLTSLATSAGTLTPVFARATTAYTASVSNATTSITVTPKALSLATVKVNTVTVASGSASGAIPLNVGPNTITTVVTAADGTTMKTYTLTVTRAAQSATNADLASLVPSAGTLAPAFASATLAYAASVPNTTTMFTVTPTASDSLATVKVNGATVVSGSASSAITLNVGPNTITTVVTAANGTTIKTYTLTVTRAAQSATNADLASLVPSAGTLKPAFASATTTYTARVPNATTTLTVTPTASDSLATVKVNGTTVASGSASDAITLNVGPNVITTVVTASDTTTTKTYTLTVTRAGTGSNNALQSLTTTAGALTPIFASTTTDYTAPTVTHATDSITITPTVMDSTATVEVNNVTVDSGAPTSIPLEAGAGYVIEIVVTAEDGTPKTYTLTVTRLPVGAVLPLDFANPLHAASGDTDLGDAVESLAVPFTRLVNAVGGIPPYNFSTDAAGQIALQAAGLQLLNNGILTTAGKAVPAGVVRFAVTVTDSFGSTPRTKTEMFRLTYVTTNQFRFAHDYLSDADQGSSYSEVLPVLRGAAPVVFTVANIAVDGTPKTTLESVGLSLSADGELYGVPLLRGRYTFIATATGAGGLKAADRTGMGNSQTFVLNVLDATVHSATVTPIRMSMKVGIPGKDSIALTAQVNLNGKPVSSLNGLPFSLRIGRFTTPPVFFDGIGKARTARGVTPQVSATLKGNGQLSVGVAKATLPRADFPAALGVEVRAGGNVLGSSFLNFDVKAGLKNSATLTYKLGVNASASDSAAQLTVVQGADDKARTGDAWKVSFLARQAPADATSAQIKIGTGYTNTIALTSRNGKLSGRVRSRTPGVVTFFSIDTTKGKGSFSTSVLPTAATGIRLAGGAGATPASFAMQVTFFKGATPLSATQGAVTIFPVKTRWANKNPVK